MHIIIDAIKRDIYFEPIFEYQEASMEGNNLVWFGPHGGGGGGGGTNARNK